jgi:uncharacterized protein (TIGR02217 family)
VGLNAFPSTRGIAWSVLKAPNWGTRLQRAISGRTLRVTDYVYPLYTFTLHWEVLLDKWDIRMGAGKGSAYPPGLTPYDELRQIWNFYNTQFGPAIPFLYYDPSDNTTRAVAATPQVTQFGVGDGITESFQLRSSLMAPVVTDVINSINIAGSPTSSYTLDSDTGRINFTSPPGNGLALTGDYTYHYIMNFSQDSLEAENFAFQFWNMHQLKMESASP